MTSTFTFIFEELALLNISKKEINLPKNKTLRLSLVERAFTRYLELNENSKITQTLKDIRRETGLKFSNETGREYFRSKKQIKLKSKYGTRLKEGYLPSDDRIPLIENRVKGQYFYGFTIYYQDTSSNKKYYSLKKNAIRLASGKYNGTGDYVYYSEMKFTKREAQAILYNLLSGVETDEDYSDMVTGSDYQKLFKKNIKVIGFVYDRLLRT